MWSDPAKRKRNFFGFDPSQIVSFQPDNQPIASNNVMPQQSNTRADLIAAMPQLGRPIDTQPRPVESAVNPGDISSLPFQNLPSLPPPQLRQTDPDSIPLPPGGHPLIQTAPAPESFDRPVLGQQGNKKYVRGMDVPIGADIAGDSSTYDFMAQARREIGQPEHRGFWKVAADTGKGALLGLLTGQGILGGAVAGGTGAYGQLERDRAIQQRAAELGQAAALQRQSRLDQDNSLFKQTQMENLVTDNRLAREKYEQEKVESAKRLSQKDTEIVDLRTYREQQLKQRENLGKASGLIRLINQPGASADSRRQLAAQLQTFGYQLPLDYNPEKDQLRLDIDPATGIASVINLTDGTSSPVAGYEGEGQYKRAPRPALRGKSGNKSGTKANDWIPERNRRTGKIESFVNRINGERRPVSAK